MRIIDKEWMINKKKIMELDSQYFNNLFKKNPTEWARIMKKRMDKLERKGKVHITYMADLYDFPPEMKKKRHKKFYPAGGSFS